ncbi:hypothetical protein CEXT_291181 [Caerostris extrusa]|uniref:Uncharacterized protein n=1 Tax=Caerostris extrusa TaxID=172846 RepID=A0AAV4VH60_CAEEX|nr:hypothetical protein CEXT_291181 [Caerostris extrusa]
MVCREQYFSSKDKALDLFEFKLRISIRLLGMAETNRKLVLLAKEITSLPYSNTGRIYVLQAVARTSYVAPHFVADNLWSRVIRARVLLKLHSPVEEINLGALVDMVSNSLLDAHFQSVHISPFLKGSKCRVDSSRAMM